jgi:putative tricarboxylic transport membrane protein
MLLLLNLPLVGMWVRLLSIPTPLLYGGILVFATLGVYSYNQSVFDLGLLLVFGIVGYVMRRFDFPVAPAIIGMILGPLAEENFRRALSITQGDYTVFVTHPISAVLLAIALLIVVAPFLMRLRQRRRPVSA